MRLEDCCNFHDFRELARRRLPGPIFNYIDGAADDEITHRRNSASFERCDLVPNVLRGVASVDLSVTMMGQRLALPVYCSPTALQRLFHHQGEHAVAAAAAKFGTLFGVSSLGTVGLEPLRRAYKTPQAYQFYFHKDRGLNSAMLRRAKDIGIDVMMLTVDTITGGNRERDLRTGFSIPFRLTLGGMLENPDGGVREDAIDLFTKIPLPGSLPYLVKALGDPSNSHLREDAADAMAAQRMTEALPYLERALQDPAANVRKAAERAIERIKSAKP